MTGRPGPLTISVVQYSRTATATRITDESYSFGWYDQLSVQSSWKYCSTRSNAIAPASLLGIGDLHDLLADVLALEQAEKGVGRVL